MQKIFDNLSVQLGTPQEQKEGIQLSENRKKSLVIAGPTGCGKTELSLMLAKTLGGEIVSVDSMQVYCGMDIGTAKVSRKDRLLVPHHLVDICDITESFNVVDFYYESLQAIDSIHARDRVPIIVGGSGFYLRALLNGPPPGPPSVPMVRKKLEEELELMGAEAFYAKLQKMDSEYCQTITPYDRHKLVRAFEIIQLTGQKVSNFTWTPHALQTHGEFRCWFIFRSREELYRRIELRCQEMLEQGFVEEVIALESKGLRNNATAAQAIGYRQCLAYLDSPRTAEDYKSFVEGFKTASRHYAKRQFTWFRKEPLFCWLNVELHDIETAADIIMQDYTQLT